MTKSELGSFYKLMWPTEGPLGVAHAPPSFELWLHPYEEVLPNWTMPTFHLQGGAFADYQPNDAIGMRHLCSEKMREVIEAHRHSTDLIEWLPVMVTDVPSPLPASSLSTRNNLAFRELLESGSLEVEKMESGEEKASQEVQDKQVRQMGQYYILHLLQELDVVDWSLSLVNPPGHVIKPHLVLNKVGEHQIFRYKGGGDNVCLSDKLRLALLKWGCTGCHFWKIPAS